MRTFKFWKGRVPTNILVGVLNRCSGSAVSHLPLEKEERPPQPKPWGGGWCGEGVRLVPGLAVAASSPAPWPRGRDIHCIYSKWSTEKQNMHPTAGQSVTYCFNKGLPIFESVPWKGMAAFSLPAACEVMRRICTHFLQLCNDYKPGKNIKLERKVLKSALRY